MGKNNLPPDVIISASTAHTGKPAAIIAAVEAKIVQASDVTWQDLAALAAFDDGFRNGLRKRLEGCLDSEIILIQMPLANFTRFVSIEIRAADLRHAVAAGDYPENERIDYFYGKYCSEQ